MLELCGVFNAHHCYILSQVFCKVNGCRHIQKDFSISYELMGILAVWMVCNSLFTGFFIYAENLNITAASEFIMILRCFLTILITAIPPLKQVLTIFHIKSYRHSAAMRTSLFHPIERILNKLTWCSISLLQLSSSITI